MAAGEAPDSAIPRNAAAASAAPNGRAPIGRYANVFRVGFNAFELVVEFGEAFDDDGGRIHTRVITNPVFARVLVDSLNDALARYASATTSDAGG
jgi:hypothetical protein